MRKINYLFLAITCLLASCATQPLSLSPEELSELHQQKILAHEAYKFNRFYESLYHWKNLSEKYPDNREFKDRIFILSKLIKRRVNVYIDRANLAMSQGEFSTAINEFERILIIDPTNNVAIKYLAQLNQVEKNRNDIIPEIEAEYSEKNKLTVENIKPVNGLENLEAGLDYFDKKDWVKAITTLKKHLGKNPGDNIAQSYVSKAHLKLSSMYYKKKEFPTTLEHFESAINASLENGEKLRHDLKSLKSNIAHYYYIEGIKAYKTNKELAISFWKKTIKYNPDHASAKTRIEKETRIAPIIRKSTLAN